MSALVLWVALAGAQDLAIRGDTVHTVSGDAISNGVVLIEDGRIVAVGQDLPIPDGVQTLTATVVTPGIVDALTVAGLSGVQNRPQDQDHREAFAPSLPGLRALDAYNPGDFLVRYLRDLGVTTIQTGASPGVPVGARSVVVSTDGDSADDAALIPDGALLFSLGEAPKATEEGRGRMAAAAVIRQALAHAADYEQKRNSRDAPTRDLGLEALAELLSGRRVAIFHAHRADDILTALRIAEEFGLRAQIAGGSEAWLVAERIAAAEVPVLLGPVMDRSWGEGETRNANFEAAAILSTAGVQVGFSSGFESYVPKVRVVHFEAAIAASNGLGFEKALRAVTLTNARLIGVDDQVGSLDVGKRADVVLWDGDPFEYTTHACAVVSAGRLVSKTCR